MNSFYSIFLFFIIVFSSTNEENESSMKVYEALSFEKYVVSLWINQKGDYSLIVEGIENQMSKIISTGKYVKDKSVMFLHKSNYQNIVWPYDLPFLVDPRHRNKILTLFVNILFWFSSKKKLYWKCLKFPSKIFPLNFLKKFFIWYYTKFPTLNFILLLIFLISFSLLHYFNLSTFQEGPSKIFFWIMMFSLIDFFILYKLFIFFHILVVWPIFILEWYYFQHIEKDFIQFLTYQPFFAMSMQIGIFVLNLKIDKNICFPPSRQQTNVIRAIVLKDMSIKKTFLKQCTRFLPFLFTYLLQILIFYIFCSYFYPKDVKNMLNFSNELVLPNSRLWPNTFHKYRKKLA